MQEKLQNFAQLPAHRATDSCIVALLSHGVEGGIYGVDGKLLQVRAALWTVLSPPACPSVRYWLLSRGQDSGGPTDGLTALLPYFFLAAARGVPALWQCQLPEPAEQAEDVLHPGLPWRWVPWPTSTWVVAPGQPPTSSHFPVCSSQVLLDPLGTSFCSLLPPPLLLCKCLPMHVVCRDLGSPWLSARSALCAPPCPVLKTLCHLLRLLFWGRWHFLCLSITLMHLIPSI